MARTTQMKLIELMILEEDISKVIEYLGKKGSCQFQTKLDDKKSVQTDGTPMINLDKEFFDKIQNIRNALGIADRECDVSNCSIPTD